MMNKFFLHNLLLMLAMAVSPLAANADHAWGNYHWARTANPFTLIVTDNMTAEWQYAFDQSLVEWDYAEMLDFAIEQGDESSKTRRRCNAKTGQIVACNQSYGNTGWLGLASINIDANGHILKGSAKMNDYYDWYWTDAERNHVTCQEIGHLFGLGHQDESGAIFDTCMDYSSSDTSQWPNAHDYEQLEAIYNHLDTYNSYDEGSGGSGGGDNSGCNAPPGKGCNKFGTGAEDLPPMGIRVHKGKYHEIWVASDKTGGYWIHHIRLAPGEEFHHEH